MNAAAESILSSQKEEPMNEASKRAKREIGRDKEKERNYLIFGSFYVQLEVDPCLTA